MNRLYVAIVFMLTVCTGLYMIDCAVKYIEDGVVVTYADPAVERQERVSEIAEAILLADKIRGKQCQGFN